MSYFVTEKISIFLCGKLLKLILRSSVNRTIKSRNKQRDSQRWSASNEIENLSFDWAVHELPSGIGVKKEIFKSNVIFSKFFFIQCLSKTWPSFTTSARHLLIAHIHRDQQESDSNREQDRHDDDQYRDLVTPSADCFGFIQSLMWIVDGHDWGWDKLHNCRLSRNQLGSFFTCKVCIGERAGHGYFIHFLIMSFSVLRQLNVS